MTARVTPLALLLADIYLGADRVDIAQFLQNYRVASPAVRGYTHARVGGQTTISPANSFS